MSSNPAEHDRAYNAQRIAKRKVENCQLPNRVSPFPSEPECPEWAKLLLAHIRGRLQATDSKAQAAVMQINVLNKQIEKLNEQVDTLTKAVLHSHQFILRLLDDPEARRFAEFVAKDVAFSNLPNHNK